MLGYRGDDAWTPSPRTGTLTCIRWLFAYAAPASLGEAVDLLGGRPGAMALAGGQSVMQAANLRELRPELLVDLGRLSELRGVSLGDGGRLVIGSGEPMADVERSALVADRAPLLARTLRTVGSVAIRNRATLGGSLAWADPSSQVPAALLALGATLRITGARGERVVDVADFPVGPGRTALGSGELLTAVELPPAAPGQATGLRLVRRTAITWPVAGCAVVRRGGRTRLGLFGAGPRPMLVSSLEELDGAVLDPPDDARASGCLPARGAAGPSPDAP